MSENNIVRIWLDGRVKTNPGVAGWAALLDFNGTRKLVYGNSQGEILTNNQTYIEAAIFALGHLKKSVQVEIVTDSQYLAKVGNWEWEQKSNVNEWKRLEHAAEPHDIKFTWQKELTCEEQKIVRTRAETEARKGDALPENPFK